MSIFTLREGDLRRALVEYRDAADTVAFARDNMKRHNAGKRAADILALAEMILERAERRLNEVADVLAAQGMSLKLMSWGNEKEPDHFTARPSEVIVTNWIENHTSRDRGGAGGGGQGGGGGSSGAPRWRCYCGLTHVMPVLKCPRCNFDRVEAAKKRRLRDQVQIRKNFAQAIETAQVAMSLALEEAEASYKRSVATS